jgi:hypothetical protein
VIQPTRAQTRSETTPETHSRTRVSTAYPETPLHRHGNKPQLNKELAHVPCRNETAERTEYARAVERNTERREDNERARVRARERAGASVSKECATEVKKLEGSWKPYGLPCLGRTKKEDDEARPALRPQICLSSTVAWRRARDSGRVVNGIGGKVLVTYP